MEWGAIALLSNDLRRSKLHLDTASITLTNLQPIGYNRGARFPKPKAP
jgi:hypothetical protein